MLTNDEIVIVILTCTFCFATIFIMGLRLTMRKLRKQKLYLSDYLTMVAIPCVLARSAFAIVVDLWGNNNHLKPGDHFTETEIYRRKIGSQLTLADRMVYNTYLWIQKAVVLLLYKQIFSGQQRPTTLIIKAYWATLLATYVAVQATSFVDCRPVQLYWQIVPNPGPCTSATIQLSTFIALNMTTDFILLVFPLPQLYSLKIHRTRRLQLIGLFSLGILLLVISIMRLPVYSNGTSQARRYTWGSVEQFAAALVANLPTLYGLCRKKGSGQDVNPNRSTGYSRSERLTERSWASEEELVNFPHFVAKPRQGLCESYSIPEEGEIMR